jgi:hypothetical protein
MLAVNHGVRAMRYVFHAHVRVRAWRLVTLEGAPLPEGARSEDWLQSRTRDADDTGSDVRREVDARGYLLFKLGGDFADVARDVQALSAVDRSGGSVSSGAAGALRAAKPLEQFPVHLGLGATASSEPEFSVMDWYAAYSARHAADGTEGRLVSCFTFERPWDSWEMHPKGSEVVVCTAGSMTLVQEIDGAQLRTELAAGEYAINAPGVWHTADVDHSATAVFITAGTGTQNRQR